MKRFRLVGTTDGLEKGFYVYAHSSLDAGARWKSDPSFYGIEELQYIEETKNDFRHYWKRTGPTRRSFTPEKGRVRPARVRSEFSF